MRINCIPVEHLADQHLRAEWVEMLMLPPYIRRSLNSKSGIIYYDSNVYTLGKGHARFFYDKVQYVINRYNDIMFEMQERGFMTNPSLHFPDYMPKKCFGDWNPQISDQYTNTNRILARILNKPTWYSYKGQKIDNWPAFYESRIPGFKWEFDEEYIGKYGTRKSKRRSK